jgi:hypothetical protein
MGLGTFEMSAVAFLLLRGQRFPNRSNKSRICAGEKRRPCVFLKTARAGRFPPRETSRCV